MTGPGTAAIAVIRISGPTVPTFLQSHFSKPPRLGRCVHGDLHDGDRILDDAVVVLVDDHTADLNLHGGNWVLRSVLDLARREGFETIENLPAPLPIEAVDETTPLRQEVLSHLPLARTETGVRALLAQEQAWKALKDQVNSERAVRDLIEPVLSDRTLWHLLHPPTVAIVGAANVGKSTLANQLFAQERSITADVPGTTRDWVGEMANVEGLPILLVDTPGVRLTHDPIEQAAIDRSRGQIERAQLILLVLDVTRPLSDGQDELLRSHPNAIRLLNKSDQLSVLGEVNGIQTVATSGHGVDDLRRQIVQFFCGELPIRPARPRWWTDRQRQVLERTLDHPNALNEL